MNAFCCSNPAHPGRTWLHQASLIAWSIAVLAMAPATRAVVPPTVTMNWGAGAQAVTGDSDVSTTGTFVSAFNFGDVDPAVASTTINGVNFTAVPVTSGFSSLSFGDFTLQETDPHYTLAPYTWGAGTFVDVPAASLSAGYQALLINSVRSMGQNTMVLTLSSLTVNNTCAFQWWNNVSPTLASGDLTLANGVSSLGKYGLGTFTAINASMKIEFNGINTGDANTWPNINAFQLRDVTSVPEPSTYAALLGLAGFGVGLLRRRVGPHP